MATSRQAQFIQRRLARRAGGSDLLRLNKDYNRQISDLTREYETSFATYQKGASEKMAGFESSMAEYNKALTTYNTDVADVYARAVEEFGKNFDLYSAEMGEIETGSRDIVAPLVHGRGPNRDQSGFEIPGVGFVPNYSRSDGTRGVQDNPELYGFDYMLTPVEAGRRGRNEYVFRPLPKTPMPTAPDKPAEFNMAAPEKPELGDFDSGQFEARRKEYDSALKREMAERRGSRMNAVQRGRGRSLLGGVQQ
jgi:hypothetical protein